MAAKKIAIFGSANLIGEQDYHQQIKLLGYRLAQMDVDIYLGSTTGLIGQFLQGAHGCAQEQSKNSTVHLIVYGDRRYMELEDVDEVQVKDCYFSRLKVLTDCDLFVVLDGQLGTMAETMVTWNQLQAKMDFDKKIIVYGESESKKVSFLLQQFIFSKQAYRELVCFVESEEEVMAQINKLS